jgi:hypothetical protein
MATLFAFYQASAMQIGAAVVCRSVWRPRAHPA